MVTVQLEQEVTGAQLQLLDPNGKLLAEQRLTGAKGSFDLAGMSPGAYWIRVVLQGEMLVSQFSKE